MILLQNGANNTLGFAGIEFGPQTDNGTGVPWIVGAVAGAAGTYNSDFVFKHRTGVSSYAETLHLYSSGGVAAPYAFHAGATFGSAFTANIGADVVGHSGYLQATRSSGEPLYLQRRSTTGRLVNFIYNGLTKGDITTNGSSVSYNTTSDYRLKENVVALTDASDRIKHIPVHRFNFIEDPDTTVDGFIAHEVQEVVPEAVHGTKDAMRDEEYEVTPAVLDDDGNVVTEAVMGTRSVPDCQSIDQSKLVPLLTAALQEALTKIDDLETRLTALEG